MPFDGARIETTLPSPIGSLGYRSPLRRLLALLLPSRSFEAAVSRLLYAARARIDHPGKWCCGHYTDSTGAVCLLIALREAGERSDGNVLISATAALRGVAHHLSFSTVELMNDGLDHPLLLAAIDEAATRFLLGRAQKEATAEIRTEQRTSLGPAVK